MRRGAVELRQRSPVERQRDRRALRQAMRYRPEPERRTDRHDERDEPS